MKCLSEGCIMEAVTVDGYCADCADELDWLENGSALRPAMERTAALVISIVIALAVIGAVVKQCRPVGEPASTATQVAR